MKTQLSSLDIHLLVKELTELLPARVQKIYDFNNKGLELVIYSFSQRTEKRLKLMPPDFFSLADIAVKNPSRGHPSSFAMLLRKHLRGGTITAMGQNNLERILEINLEKKDKKFFLIAEFFSKGNIFLCNEEKKIIGLQTWQRWKDRVLGVGQEYNYPPSLPNPLKITSSELATVLSNSPKSLAATLVLDLNFGATYSEEICFNSGIEKEKKSNKLTPWEKKAVFQSLQKLLKKLSGHLQPSLVLKDSKPVDVIPFELGIYSSSKWEKKSPPSFTQAINQYFSSREKKAVHLVIEDRFQKKMQHLLTIKKNQTLAIEDLRQKEIYFKKSAELIYQHLPAIENILNLSQETKNRAELTGKKIEKISVKEFKGTSLLLEI